MIPLKTLRSFASQIGSLLSGDASSSTDDRQNAAGQRKDLDITKSQEAQLSEELGNVVRVPSKDGTGVSQAPAIEVIRKDTSMASEQPQVALQGQPTTAVSTSPPSDADSIRMHLMEAVRQARAAIKDCKPMHPSTAADYARKTKHLTRKIKALAKTWPRQGADQAAQIMKVALGEYAGKSNSFFAQRRAMQYWVQQRLADALKTQDQLQKSWSKASSAEQQQSLLEQMHAATLQLSSLRTQFLEAGAFDRQVCQQAFTAYSSQIGVVADSAEDANALQTKQLLVVLNRRLPDWQQAFRLANDKSKGRYRSHALLQSLTGIRPTEFDPQKNQPHGAAGGKSVEPGVVATLCDGGPVRVRVPGGKVGTHSGQVERFFELEMDSLPGWFVQELKDARGSKVFKAKPQALRDHYERVSKKVFAGMTYGKAKKPLHATPYCFRHALATELRTSGWSVDEIAAVLGQRSADTQSHYGFRKGGKRKPKEDIQTSIVAGSVTTTSPVRAQKNSWAQACVEIRSGKTNRSSKL